MLFNSLDFAVFFPVVFFLYWWMNGKSLRLQNALLLVASYFFYACWDWRFLFLLMFSTLLDYFTGLMMCQSETQTRRRIWFWLSVVVNLGLLGVFKYYNFFVESFADFVSLLGLSVHPVVLHLILPVGISFYTFHGLSYVIDIYFGKIKAERNFIDYGLFVSFFPLLVAGPIERATHLLPQIKQERVFDYSKSVDGLRQILWGLFKKVVIADNCGVVANYFFTHTEEASGSGLLLGVILFTIQIYGDFSGYSDIALGTARLLGIELLRNFAFPFFSRNVAEHWRRWHISLTSWFRDYVYIPILGGSRVSTWKRIRNTYIIFWLSGLWHGPGWTYMLWSTVNATYFVPLLLTKQNRRYMDTAAQGRSLPTFRELIAILSTFSLTVFAHVFFGARSMSHLWTYLTGLFSTSLFTIPDFPGRKNAFVTILLVIFFLIVEWMGRENQHALGDFGTKWRRPQRWMFYMGLCALLVLFMQTEGTPFIYFQF